MALKYDFKSCLTKFIKECNSQGKKKFILPKLCIWNLLEENSAVCGIDPWFLDDLYFEHQNRVLLHQNIKSRFSGK